MNFIQWPEGYLPGTTDNFASNEIIVTGLTMKQIWPYIANPLKWPTYYQNASDIHFYNVEGPELEEGAKFRFVTFGLTVEAEVTEFVPPLEGQPARIAWHGWCEGTVEEKLDVHHAWLFEDLEGDRVRILTQETQNGFPAKKMAVDKPNPMINAHQDWIEGLAKIAMNK